MACNESLVFVHAMIPGEDHGASLDFNVVEQESRRISFVVFRLDENQFSWLDRSLQVEVEVVADFTKIPVGQVGNLGDIDEHGVQGEGDDQRGGKAVAVDTSNGSRAVCEGVLKDAQTFDVKVYTIGAGTRGKAPFLTDSAFGQRVVYQDVEIDEETLQAIADRTGGLYFRAEDLKGLEQVYDEIDRLEKTEITTNSYMEFDEQFSAFVAPAVLLLLLEVVLLGTRLRKLP